MLLLKKIHLCDFLSHRDTEIVFKDKHKLLIDGQSGGGKSSVVEAILWCLYGQGRSLSRSLVRRGGKNAVVTLDLKDGDNEYTIKRTSSVSGKNTLSVTKNAVAIEKNGIKEIQDWIIKDLLRSSYLLFVNSIAYVQGGGDLFVSQPASKRKDLLLEIINSENIDEYYDKIRNKILKIETNTKTLSEEGDAAGNTVALLQSDIGKKKELEERLSDLKGILYACTKEKELLTEQISKHENEIKTIDDLKKAISGINDDIGFLTTQILTYVNTNKEDLDLLEKENKTSPFVRSIEQLDISIDEKEQKKALASKERIIAIETQNKKQDKLKEKPNVIDYSPFIEQYSKQINSIQSENTCPSGDLCPFFKKELETMAELMQKMVDLTKKSEQEKILFSKWEKEYTSMPDIDIGRYILEEDKINDEIRELKIKKNEIERKKSQMESMAGDLLKKEGLEIQRKQKEENRNGLVSSLSVLEQAINIVSFNELKAKKEALALKEKEAENQGKELERQLIIIESKETQLVSLGERIIEIDKIILGNNKDLSSLQELKTAFGSKGIKTLIIDYILPNLEEKINNILEQMSNFRVRLDTQQEKNSGDGNKEGLFITIVNEMGEEMDYDNYSGGEKVRIIVAITEGLATLTKNIGFRIMDEAIHSMNPDMTSDFVEVVEKLQQKYPQVVMITHIDEVKNIFDEQLIITKRNGVSSIKTI